MKKWLKYGLITGAIFIIIFVVLNLINFAMNIGTHGKSFIYDLTALFGDIFGGFFGLVFLFLILPFFVGFLIGIIIVLIFKKGKPEKQENESLENPSNQIKEHSQKKRFWLRYGLIALIIGIISFFLTVLTIIKFLPSFILTILGFPFFIMGFAFGHNILIAGILGLVFYFLIGAIIGLIVKKVKSLSRPQQNKTTKTL